MQECIVLTWQKNNMITVHDYNYMSLYTYKQSKPNIRIICVNLCIKLVFTLNYKILTKLIRIN